MTTHCSKHRTPRVPTVCCNVMYQCFCRGRRWFSSQKLLHIYRRPYVDSVDERVLSAHVGISTAAVCERWEKGSWPICGWEYLLHCWSWSPRLLNSIPCRCIPLSLSLEFIGFVRDGVVLKLDGRRNCIRWEQMFIWVICRSYWESRITVLYQLLCSFLKLKYTGIYNKSKCYKSL